MGVTSEEADTDRYAILDGIPIPLGMQTPCRSVAALAWEHDDDHHPDADDAVERPPLRHPGQAARRRPRRVRREGPARRERRRPRGRGRLHQGRAVLQLRHQGGAVRRGDRRAGPPDDRGRARGDDQPRPRDRRPPRADASGPGRPRAGRGAHPDQRHRAPLVPAGERVPALRPAQPRGARPVRRPLRALPRRARRPARGAAACARAVASRCRRSSWPRSPSSST